MSVNNMKISPYKRKVQYYENDSMGAVHHANYILWFEEARVDYMEQLGYGYEKSVASGIDIILTSLSCNYKSMARFGETVIINLSMSRIDPVRMTVEYRVTDEETGTLRITGETNHCFYHRQKGLPVSLKKTLPELYELFRKQYEKE